MTFTTIQFLLFLVVVFALYYVVPKKYQWVLLLIASYAFYAYSGLSNLIYIVVTTVSTYLIAKKIDALRNTQEAYLKEHKETLSREEKKSYKQKAKSTLWKWLLVCLIFNFGILAVVKYTDFVIGNINSLFNTQLGFFGFVVPLGISYYTFMTMSYVIDVYRGKCTSQTNLFKFALFASFFPHLVQGPIGRYGEMSKTLYSEHTFDTNHIYKGLTRILWGYFKKMIVADRILVACKTLFGDPTQYSGLFVLIGLIFYSVDIYADFTGGIDITIGIAEMFGVELTENFNHPYFSKDLAEFWRRWHITMGTWFKDYIFYPISVCKPMLKLSKWSRKTFGDKIGKRIPVYVATLVVWFLTGVWHGAAWHFIVWGLMNAVVILISQEFDPFYKWFHSKVNVANKKWYQVFQMVRTFMLVSFLRVFDCYGDVPLSFHQLSTIFTHFNIAEVCNGALLKLGLNLSDYIVLGICILLMWLVSYIERDEVTSIRDVLCQKNVVIKFLVVYLLIFAIIIFGAYGVGFDASSFIYNQF